MKIPTEFLTDYLIERDLDWEAFEGFSTMAVHKKDVLIANWRFGNELSQEEIKSVFKAFKGLVQGGLPIQGLTYDEFITAYVKQLDKRLRS